MIRTITLFYNKHNKGEFEGFVVLGRLTKKGKMKHNSRTYPIDGKFNRLYDLLRRLGFEIDTKCEDFFEIYAHNNWNYSDDYLIIQKLNLK